MKYKITQQEYDTLDDTLKEMYVADGENFKLDLEDAPEDKSSEIERVLNALKAERQAHKDDKNSLKEQMKALEAKLAPEKKEIDDDQNVPETTDPTLLAMKKKITKQEELLNQIMEQKESLEKENKKKTITDKLVSALNGKVIPSAIEDAKMFVELNTFSLTDDNEVVAKDGTNLNDWVTATLESKPHWIAPNISSGAKGGNSANITPSNEKRLKELRGKESLTQVEQLEAVKLLSEIKDN